jgi:hypothetical protein
VRIFIHSFKHAVAILANIGTRVQRHQSLNAVIRITGPEVWIRIQLMLSSITDNLWPQCAAPAKRRKIVSVAEQQIRTGLDALFLPDPVAVIGATERAGTVGRTILENLLHPSFSREGVCC